MVAFVASMVISALMVGVILVVARRRPPGTPLTWGEAFVAALWVFTLMVLVYGIVPNQWLLWADNELQWRKDAFFVAPGTQLHKIIRVVVPKEAVRDVIATMIYVVGVGGHVKLWLWWQRRGDVKPVEIERSAYGRPLVRAGEGG